MQLFKVVAHKSQHALVFAQGIQTRQAQEHDTRHKLMLAENQFAKIFVGREQGCLPLPAGAQDRFICQAGLCFGDIVNLISRLAKSRNDVSIHALISHQGHTASRSSG